MIGVRKPSPYWALIVLFVLARQTAPTRGVTREVTSEKWS